MTVSDCLDIVTNILPEPHAGLLAGMMFGTKSVLSHDMYDALIQTGTLHIVALSGFNITILIQLVSLVLLRFVNKITASIITIGFILWFVWFVGFSPPVVRASIMGSIGLLAIVLGRQVWSLYILILTSAGMVLVYPPWAGDVSFQLSVAATLGIILWGSPRKILPGNKQILSCSSILPYYSSDTQRIRVYVWNRLRSYITDELRVTLSAQVCTTPLILLYFHRISLISPLTNLLIGMAIAPVTAAGIALVIAGYVWMPLARVIGWFTWVLLEYIVFIVEYTAGFPYAGVSF